MMNKQTRAGSQQASAPRSMYDTPPGEPAEIWEYTFLNARVEDLATEIHAMNAAGAVGWELVNGLPLHSGQGFRAPGLTSSVLLLFKRRRPR